MGGNEMFQGLTLEPPPPPPPPLEQQTSETHNALGQRRLPDYTRPPNAKALFKDYHVKGRLWRSITAALVVAGIGAALLLEVFVNGMLVLMYRDPVSVAQADARGGLLLAYDHVSLYIWLAIVPFLVWRRRHRQFQSSLYIYQDRVRINFDKLNFRRDIFAQDIIFIVQEGATIRIKTRVLVDIHRYRRYTTWKIKQKAPEAIAKDNTFSVRVYTEDIETVRQMLKKHWSLKFGKTYELTKQEFSPSLVYTKRDLVLPSSSMSWRSLLRRLAFAFVLVALSHYCLIAVRRLWDLYVGRRMSGCLYEPPSSSASQGCRWIVLDSYDWALGSFVALLVLNQFWHKSAARLDLFRDRVRVMLHGRGVAVHVLLRHLCLIRECKPDLYVTPGSLTLYCSQYHVVEVRERDLLSIVRVFKSRRPTERAFQLRLLDGGRHPLVVLNKSDKSIFLNTLNAFKTKSSSLWAQYRADMTRIDDEEHELQKVNRFLRVKRPDPPAESELKILHDQRPGWKNEDTWNDVREFIEDKKKSGRAVVLSVYARLHYCFAPVLSQVSSGGTKLIAFCKRHGARASKRHTGTPNHPGVDGDESVRFQVPHSHPSESVNIPIPSAPPASAADDGIASRPMVLVQVPVLVAPSAPSPLAAEQPVPQLPNTIVYNLPSASAVEHVARTTPRPIEE